MRSEVPWRSSRLLTDEPVAALTAPPVFVDVAAVHAAAPRMRGVVAQAIDPATPVRAEAFPFGAQVASVVEVAACTNDGGPDRDEAVAAHATTAGTSTRTSGQRPGLSPGASLSEGSPRDPPPLLRLLLPALRPGRPAPRRRVHGRARRRRTATSLSRTRPICEGDSSRSSRSHRSIAC